MSERRACRLIKADRRLHILLRAEGHVLNRKKTQRLYREEGLTVRKRKGRKRATGIRAPTLVEARPNARWSVDFVHDQLSNGRRFRILNVSTTSPRNAWRPLPTPQSPAGEWRASSTPSSPGAASPI